MTTEQPRVSVIIPNWNGIHHLPECLDTLFAQAYKDFEVIVVDNASTDDSVVWIHEHYPQISVLGRPDNAGFAIAVNEGIRASHGEYVALLNNDTAVDADWLGALVEALDGRPTYSFAASKMIFHDRPQILNAAGDTWSWSRMAAQNRGYGKPVTLYSEVERVLGACAGAALYRRALFNKVGCFDEDFFLIHEDTDFNLRCLLMGERCLYVPQARVRHKHGASIDLQPSQAMTRLCSRNETAAAMKNLPLAILVLWFPLWPLRTLRSTIPFRPTNWHMIPSLIRRLPARTGAEVEGLRMGLAKRKEVQSQRTVKTREITHWLWKGAGPV